MHKHLEPWRDALAASVSLCAGLMLVAALAGCAAFEPVQAPAPRVALNVPLAWSTADAGLAATPLAAWWRRFDDALLVSLIDDALRANTSLEAARAALAQSRAAGDLQSAALRPALGGSVSAQRSRRGIGNTGANSPGSTASVSTNTFSAGFDASWEPDIFGAVRAGVSAADADVQASAASLGDAQVSVAAEVAVNYLQLRSLQQRLAIAGQNLQSQQETLQITQWRE
ncbi:TolC family protein, partial [Roseateles sp.]|uniref:TolC family protein n=1 Tax=Roseateles sp. TaxID=1971397 RepID=UPI003265452C